MSHMDMAEMDELSEYLLQWARSGGSQPQDLFGVYLRLLRRKRGVSRDELAEQLNVSAAQLVAIEVGLVPLSELSANFVSDVEGLLKMRYSDFVLATAKTLEVAAKVEDDVIAKPVSTLPKVMFVDTYMYVSKDHEKKSLGASIGRRQEVMDP